MAALVCGTKRSFAFEDDVELCRRLSKRHCPTFCTTTIKKLQEVMASSETTPIEEPQPQQQQQQPVGQDKGNVVSEEDYKWVELFVGEMSSAASVDDAKARAARVLAARDQKKSVEINQQLVKKILKLNEDMSVLKKAVKILYPYYERVKETEQEVVSLNGKLLQCREELRIAEMDNYALKVHLSQTQVGSSSMFNTSNLPPDVC